MSNMTATNPKGKVVCLVSGGIDSPVAAWLFIKKGYVPIFAFFDNNPLSDETTKRRAFESMNKVMKDWPSMTARVYVVPHGENLIDVITKCPRKLTCIICRRFMFRVAERIATAEGAHAIVTGEILGEHASQTLYNLASISSAIRFPILRPLIGMNKLEVEQLARRIGTFEISTKPASCCRGAPKQPRTKSKRDEVLSAENRLDTERMTERAFKAAKVETITSSCDQGIHDAARTPA